MPEHRAAPPPPIRLPQSESATTIAELEPGDENQPRVFPCENCGADLTFNIGAQRLKCDYCGHVKELATDAQAAIAEQDFHATLQRLATLRDRDVTDENQLNEVRCDACGAIVLSPARSRAANAPTADHPCSVNTSTQAHIAFPWMVFCPS